MFWDDMRDFEIARGDCLDHFYHPDLLFPDQQRPFSVARARDGEKSNHAERPVNPRTAMSALHKAPFCVPTPADGQGQSGHSGRGIRARVFFDDPPFEHSEPRIKQKRRRGRFKGNLLTVLLFCER